MRLANAFLSGMRSAYEVLPNQTKHKAHFIKTAEVTVVNFSVDSNITDSWKAVASCQKRAFKEVCHNHHENLEAYEYVPAR